MGFRPHRRKFPVTQDLDHLLERAARSIDEAADLVALDAVRVAYLGKKGEITAQLKNLGQLPTDERPAAGQAINQAKLKIQELLDARKAVQMFRKVDMSVLGIVENMSTHICSQCGHEEAIFGSGGGSRMSEEYEVPLLGQLPLSLQIRQDLDQGMPTVVSDPGSELTDRYRELARRTAARLAQTPRNLALNLPQINILNS